MQIGAHVSVAKGLIEALDYAQSVGCECMQIFAKSPRQWRGPRLDAHAAEAFIQEREARGFGPVFTHTAYLINLSTTDEMLREKSIDALADELRRGSALSASGVVTHVGNDPEGDATAAARRAGESIARAFILAGGQDCRTRLLLENTAGAGRTFGGALEELAAIIEASDIPANQIGICFDTCHAFAYGMPVDSAAGWAEVASAIDATVGASALRVIHANDCKFERGSHKDRHEWIGDGNIGESGFGAMLCQPQLQHACVITEMPGEVPEKDAVNNLRLVALRDACVQSQ